MAKRGRKRIHKRYFDLEQEKAIVDYQNSICNVEKNQIYEEFLKMPLYKMAESIVNRYQLQSLYLPFEELMDDILGDLILKIGKFDPTRGTKAYSYFGTIIKRYAMAKRIKEQAEGEKVSSYDVYVESVVDDTKHSYQISDEDTLMKEFFYEYIKIVDSLLERNKKETFLKPNEEKIGIAVIHLMKNYDKVFDDGGHKYNKAQILECLRNMTGLSTKDIRDNLKKFKEIYFQNKETKIDNEYNRGSNSIPKKPIIDFPKKRK